MKNIKKNRSKSIARMAGVQGLYEIEISGCSRDDTIIGYLQHTWPLEDWDNYKEPNEEKFLFLINGVCQNIMTLDKIISCSLDKGRRLESLDVLLKMILRAGTFELIEETNTPIAVIIDEYVQITNAFYFENEPALVNAVLDNIGNGTRNSRKLN